MKTIMTEPSTIDSRVSKLEGIIQQVAESVESIARQVDRVATAQKPNTMNMVATLTLVLGIVGTIGTLVGIFLFREMDSNANAYKELDGKLQREYTLINATTAQQIENVNKASLERHDDALAALNRVVTKIDRMQAFTDSQVEADLNELRQRRMKQAQ